ncbi:succinate dehydrogenase assembly factor 4, mitochondrial isoform X1 [Orcinus orca]|uniref:succinate dehydrogenase assembly factor 4, mitochondrial isoform X1 n=1 Tax=Orcinus orca TaxID=9733 RepID=UPI002111A96A|nr:succinate dehydrogenase assembly factor 4, mitochondrial isoform X1 [Orcinus orca]
MVVLGFTSLLGHIAATAWRAARSPILCHSLRKISSQGEKSKPIKQPLKKPKLPEGRFDAPEDSNLEKEPLTILISDSLRRELLGLPWIRCPQLNQPVASGLVKMWLFSL